MAKGYKCPTCEGNIGKYENGCYICTDEDCGAIWWGPFDQPSAGEKGKGHKCPHCQRQTVHLVATLNEIKIWRCSTCAATQIEK